MTALWILLGGLGALVVVAIYDLTQRRHAILRNFPILGHFRYLLEAVGPELRQYIVTNNDEERPFSRDQRTWVYTSAKRVNNYFGFGSDNDMERAPCYPVLKHAAFPYPDPLPGEAGYRHDHPLPCAKVLGEARGRRKPFRPASVVNVSAMSYGSLSARAVEALNRGAALCGCLHNTGEGGISSHHDHGGGLIWQLGTGYFGCRDKRGRFDMSCFQENVEAHNVRAVEVKLSQGAKPGRGGILPGAKVTAEIAAIRGVGLGEDCISPSSHREFSDVAGLLDFVDRLAEVSGLPVGIKSAVGELAFWQELAQRMEREDRGPDFITVDGGEGGTGAGPLAFTDHVALPFKLAMARVFPLFAERGVDRKVVFIGSGKLGFPETALFAFALGCDMIAVAREAMLAIGCIQAQRCHTGHCPTGVATQSKWLVRGLDPTSKAARLANYVMTLRHEILSLARAGGVAHPALLDGDHLEILDGHLGSKSLSETFAYQEGWGQPGPEDREEIVRIMDEMYSGETTSAKAVAH